MNFEIIMVPEFDKELKRLHRKYPSIRQDILDLTAELITDPIQGEPLGKDCYKIRMAISSKNEGKSGGSRVITCVKIIDETVILLAIYGKSEKEDIEESKLKSILKINDLL